MSDLTQKELKRLLDYNSNTGVFTWKIKPARNIKVNSIAGYINNKKHGYVHIGINGIEYAAHRLAWLYVYGYLPENMIDHKDKNGNHNWIDNLREVSKICNARNCGNPKNNTSGIKGISWYKTRKKWKAYIMINKKSYHMGIFNDFDEAVCHRLAAEQCLNWSGCDSNSPAYQYVKENIQGVDYEC